MNYASYAIRLNYLLEMIDKGQLSSPNDLTKRFECSEKTVRNMINSLREMGHKIKYSRRNGRYFLQKK